MSGPIDPIWSVDDFDTALPATAQPTAPEPGEDAGHLLPQDVWDEVVLAAEEAGR